MPPSTIAGMAITVGSPNSHQAFPLGDEVTFKGQFNGEVGSVSAFADSRFNLGPVTIQGNKWSFKRRFSSSGLRHVVVTAFDAQGQSLGSDFVDVLIQPPPLAVERRRMIDIAAGQLGVSEDFNQPNNFGAKIAKYQQYAGFGQGTEWCFCFLNWVFHEATNRDPDWGKSLAFVPGGVAWAKRNNRWIRENDPHEDGFAKGDPEPGDLICMGDFEEFNQRKNYPHIEMVVRVTPDTIFTIGGNVSDRVKEQQHTRVGNDPGGRYIAGYVKAFP